MRRLTIGVTACTETMGLLVAMAWADGELRDEEKAGIRAAADTLNLNQELRDRLESFMAEAPALGDLNVSALNSRDRQFAFVASAWLARVDDGIEQAERDLLDEIGKLLDIDAERRAELSQLAFDLDPPAGAASWSDGIVKLFKTIVSKVENEEIEVSFE